MFADVAQALCIVGPVPVALSLTPGDNAHAMEAINNIESTEVTHKWTDMPSLDKAHTLEGYAAVSVREQPSSFETQSVVATIEEVSHSDNYAVLSVTKQVKDSAHITPKSISRPPRFITPNCV